MAPKFTALKSSSTVDHGIMVFKKKNRTVYTGFDVRNSHPMYLKQYCLDHHFFSKI